MIKASEQNLPMVRQLPETEHWLSLQVTLRNFAESLICLQETR
jgi:hypothetical protein